jgi:hypothetical protein
MEQYKQQKITKIFKTQLQDFAAALDKDYSINGSKRGNIQKKGNNFLISSLGKEIMVYSALMRSLDSSLGNRIEDIALEVAEASGFKVSQGVEGLLSGETTNLIATLLESYKDKNNAKKPSIVDLELIQQTVKDSEGKSKFHNSDYLLEKQKDGITYLTLLELKAGGDLDNKKARSEKEAILEQYAILISEYEEQVSNGSVEVALFFATAYNKDALNSGSENWKQGSVISFFAPDELLIGKDFWNFVCDDEDGWEVITSAYKENSQCIANSLQKVIASFKD